MKIKTLLQYLSQKPINGQWQGWHIEHVLGGANNLIYRVRNATIDWAIKFSVDDARRRAQREYHALLALQQAGLDIAPKPILIDETSFQQPVMVQSWIPGPVTAVPPQTDTQWQQLLAHYAAIHSVTPDRVQLSLATAALNFHSIDSAWQAIRQQLDHIPFAAQPASLRKCVSQLQAKTAPDMPPARHALCRVDANTLNFIRTPKGWHSVDWENSGWGDPAFEMVDMMCHPKYHEVPHSRWRWVAEQYAMLTEDVTAVARINAYYPYMLVWWAARLSRMLYEVPLGIDERLVQRPLNWQADLNAKYQWYLDQVTAHK